MQLVSMLVVQYAAARGAGLCAVARAPAHSPITSEAPTQPHLSPSHRCVDTGRSLPRDEADRFLLRAEPLRAALDPESFFLSEIIRKTGGGRGVGDLGPPS